MSARLAMLAAVVADLAAAPLPGVSPHTGALLASVDLHTVAGVVLGTSDTASESATVSAKRLGALDVVLTARVYADAPVPGSGIDVALVRARAAADALAARWLDTDGHPLALTGFAVLTSRLALALPLPAGDPASTLRGEIVSVRFTLTPA